jgi:hypothetical protein
MKHAKKSWTEKLRTNASPHVEVVEKQFAGIRPGQLMLVPTPLLVDAYIRQIPRGTEVEVDTLKKDLAAEYHAEVTCPLTTGIFLRIVAEAAYEALQEGVPMAQITPFWRVVRPGSTTAGKLSFGTALLNQQRTLEKLPMAASKVIKQKRVRSRVHS